VSISGYGCASDRAASRSARARKRWREFYWFDLSVCFLVAPDQIRKPSRQTLRFGPCHRYPSIFFSIERVIISSLPFRFAFSCICRTRVYR